MLPHLGVSLPSQLVQRVISVYIYCNVVVNKKKGEHNVPLKRRKTSTPKGLSSW